MKSSDLEVSFEHKDKSKSLIHLQFVIIYSTLISCRWKLWTIWRECKFWRDPI